MSIKTLQSIIREQLVNVFNEAFSDYILRITLTPEMLEYRIKRDRIDLSASYGYFEDGKICGFILHGTSPYTWFNAGTAVIPSKRGQGITKKIYKKILEDAPKYSVKEMRLEVITSNTRAVKIYKDTGFKISRELLSFKGTMDLKEDNAISIKESTQYDWGSFPSFWEYMPSWQNDKEAVVGLKKANILLEAFEGEQITGYIIYNPGLKRIIQFAAEKGADREKTFTALFKYIQQNYSPDIEVYNIDASAIQSLSFIKKAGLKEIIRQYEMTYKL